MDRLELQWQKNNLLTRSKKILHKVQEHHHSGSQGERRRHVNVGHILAHVPATELRILFVFARY